MREVLEQLETELRQEIETLFYLGRLSGVVQVLKKYFSRRSFWEDFSGKVSFDLIIVAKRSRRTSRPFRRIPLATLGGYTTYSKGSDRDIKRLLDAFNQGKASKKALRKLMRKSEKDERFGCIGFGLMTKQKTPLSKSAAMRRG